MHRILLFIFVFLIVLGAGLIAHDKPEYPATIIPNPPREASSMPAWILEDRFWKSLPSTISVHPFWQTFPLVHAKFFATIDPTGFYSLARSTYTMYILRKQTGENNLTSSTPNTAGY
jgi:hypothetical protein